MLPGSPASLPPCLLCTCCWRGGKRSAGHGESTQCLAGLVLAHGARQPEQGPVLQDKKLSPGQKADGLFWALLKTGEDYILCCSRKPCLTLQGLQWKILTGDQPRSTGDGQLHPCVHSNSHCRDFLPVTNSVQKRQPTQPLHALQQPSGSQYRIGKAADSPAPPYPMATIRYL